MITKKQLIEKMDANAKRSLDGFAWLYLDKQIGVKIERNNCIEELNKHCRQVGYVPFENTKYHEAIIDYIFNCYENSLHVQACLLEI